MSAPVYPRWRGEHPCGISNIFWLCGLSPLARGTLIADSTTAMLMRFIPAGAGNTRLAPSCVRSLPVYPRWRGEHINPQNPLMKNIGLSPLARGTPTELRKTCFLSRFIPAGAGNTLRTHRGIGDPAVYPRWRGEHLTCAFAAYSAAGLSPLARGTQELLHPKCAIARFIPAGAGNTCLFWKSCHGASVYPRWRGEHYYNALRGK